MNEKEATVAVIEGMVQRRQWSMNYKSVEDALSKLPSRLKKLRRKALDALVAKGWAGYHKNNSCVSLNSSKKDVIKRFLKEHGDLDTWVLEALF